MQYSPLSRLPLLLGIPILTRKVIGYETTLAQLYWLFLTTYIPNSHMNIIRNLHINSKDNSTVSSHLM